MLEHVVISSISALTDAINEGTEAKSLEAHRKSSWRPSRGSASIADVILSTPYSL